MIGKVLPHHLSGGEPFGKRLSVTEDQWISRFYRGYLFYKSVLSFFSSLKKLIYNNYYLISFLI
jgi:hypothetical protein